MMKKSRFKRMLALFLSVFMLLSLTANAAPIGSGDLVFENLGSKTAEALVKPGQYEITVGVPGALETEEYSEIIVMVDGSDSQTGNLAKLKETLVDIARQVLHNDGSVRLTLMGFGMGPALVGSFYNAETLEAYLQNVTQRDFLQGVSATNCEVAFEFIREYIESSDKLNKTCVIFTSDGYTNMDEEEFQLLDWEHHQADWMQRNVTVKDVYETAAYIQTDMLKNGEAMLNATTHLFPVEATAVEIAKIQKGIGSEEHIAAVNTLYNTILASPESGIAYVDEIMKEAITSAGFDPAKAYSDQHGTAGWGARAVAEADSLCENEKVLDLFMLNFSNESDIWMNPESAKTYKVTSEKVTHLTSSDYQVAVDQMKELTEEMLVTLYKDTTVTDPMSKWVILNEESIKICRDDEVIWTKKDGWLIEEAERPVPGSPVSITTNGDGHREIEWLIKKGALLYTDRYFLKYTVDVDDTVEGFEYNKDYPANDPTFVTYEDENGDEIIKEIPVPDVKLPKQDDFKEDDLGIRIYKGTSDSKPISDITFDIYKVPEDAETVSAIPTSEEVDEYAVSANRVGQITTDANGYAAINLTDEGEGIYLLIEEDNEKVVAPVDPFYVMVPMYDTKDTEDRADDEYVKVVSVYPKNTVKPEEEPPIPPVIPEDPEDKNTGSITILKHQEGDENAVLAKAEFQLYKLVTSANASADAITMTYNGVEVILEPTAITLTTDENGKATTSELAFGLYFLVETKAPVGFVALNEPIPAWVTATSHSEAYTIKIPNSLIMQLPETGGMGTTLFTVVGILVIAGGVVLLFKRRKDSEK